MRIDAHQPDHGTLYTHQLQRLHGRPRSTFDVALVEPGERRRDAFVQGRVDDAQTSPDQQQMDVLGGHAHLVGDEAGITGEAHTRRIDRRLGMRTCDHGIDVTRSRGAERGADIGERRGAGRGRDFARRECIGGK